MWGLNFSGETNVRTLNYLDLTLVIEGDTIFTKTFFNLVDCYSLLEFNSCPFEKWLTIIPFGQFKKLCRNCMKNADFVTQSRILKKCFKDKKSDPYLRNNIRDKPKMIYQRTKIVKNALAPSDPVKTRMKNLVYMEPFLKGSYKFLINRCKCCAYITVIYSIH